MSIVETIEAAPVREAKVAGFLKADSPQPLPLSVAVGCAVASGLLILTGEPSWSPAAMRALNPFATELRDFFKIFEQFGSKVGIVTILAAVILLDQRGKARSIHLLIGIACTAITTSILKGVYGRQRPMFLHKEDYAPRFPDQPLGGWWGAPKGLTPPGIENPEWYHLLAWDRFLSFPSGHSSMAAFLAAFLTMYYRRGWPLWWTLAGFCFLQRFIYSRHWLSDTLMGAAVGITIAYVLAMVVSRRGTVGKTASSEAG